MRNKFKGYYQQDNSFFEALWSNAFFTFDANILLNLYRYSESTRNDIINILKNNVNDRIWITHQCGLEFNKNRLNTIAIEIKAYKDLEEEINTYKNKLNQKLESNRHPFISKSVEMIKKVEELFENIISDLSIEKSKLTDLYDEDLILEEILNIFDGKVGPNYNKSKLDEIFREGKERFEKKIPPGFMDKNKDENNMYGDLVVWYQILDYAKENVKPFIFVTDDKKADWWLIHNNKRIGYSPELYNEVKEKTDQDFYIYDIEQFLEYSKKYFKSNVDDKTISEVKKLNKIDYTSLLNRYDEIKKDNMNFLNFIEDRKKYSTIIKDVFNLNLENNDILKERILSGFYPPNQDYINNWNEQIRSAKAAADSYVINNPLLQHFLELKSNDDEDQVKDNVDEDNNKEKNED